MTRSSYVAALVALVRIAVSATMACLAVWASVPPKPALAHGGIDSTITLQMPFIAGQQWVVGGGGSFYGDYLHSNVGNDYYATDWNFPSGLEDAGQPVLPIADGTVTAVDSIPCGYNGGFGCFVQIDHADGYRSVYAHLETAIVSVGSQVRTSTLIGYVGSSGTGTPHLHLRLLRYNHSKCWNNGFMCPGTPNSHNPLQPQGHMPSPMRTTAGVTALTDGSQYVSVNGRVHLADLQNQFGNLSVISIRNNGISTRSITIRYFGSSGGSVPHFSETLTIGPKQQVRLPINNTRVSAGTSGSAYIDGAENLGVLVETEYDGGGRHLASMYPAETLPDLIVHVPYVTRNWYSGNAAWRQTTDLVIRNTSTTSPATVSVSFFDSWSPFDGAHHLSAFTIPANGRITVSGTQMPLWDFGATASLASARILSSQPIAVVVNTKTGVSDGNGTITTPWLTGSYRGFARSGAGTTVYLPLVGKTWYSYDSSPQIQNTNANDVTFSITFYNPNGTVALHLANQNVGAYRSVNFWRPAGLPNNWLGSAVVQSTYGGPLVGMSQYDVYDSGNQKYGVSQYEALTSSTLTSVFARLNKTPPWTYTGIQTQNTGTTTQSTYQIYYYMHGGFAGSSISKSVAPNAAANFWASGSEVLAIEGSGMSTPTNFATEVNIDRMGDAAWINRDGLMGYGVVR